MLVRCSACGGDFELSARQARDHRSAGTTPRCSRCRYGTKPPQATEKMRRWWLDRFTVDEIRELAAGLWPDDSRGP